jgi:hypothetical protein
MIKALRRFRIPLQATDPSNDGSVVPDEPVGSRLDFVAYAEDSVLSGRLELRADRLTDLLNEHDEFVLESVLVSSLTDGHAIEAAELLVARDELFLVHATGPRGSRGRRQRTRQHALAMQLGPYHVRGYVHALPGTDPIANLRRRRPMVPLTEAWIEYELNGVREGRRVSTVVVNRHQLDWVVEAADEEVEYPEIPVKAGPLVKDFTGSLRV